MNSLFTRRSVREFRDWPVEREKLMILLKAAMQAPSAANQQPWEFLVVTDREMLRKLSGTSQYSRCLEKAGAAVVVLKNENHLLWPDSADQDLSAATMALLLAATELGLGGVWLGIAPYQERMEYVKVTAGLPEGISPFSIVALGYPLQPQANHEINRYRPEKIHFEQYADRSGGKAVYGT